MKKLNEKVLKAVAKVSKYTAEKACGAASFWGCYQPEEPAMMKKSKRK